METSSEISKQRFLQTVQNILDKTRMFEDRFVIFEKRIEPSEVYIPKEEAPNGFDGFEGLFRSRNYAHMLWHDHSGELHSYNDMPSKISLSCDYRELNLEWHKNGVPFRNNNKFNKFNFLLPTYYSSNDDEFRYTAEWLNKKCELHSYNDMPAKITQSSVEWYWNGENCRIPYNFQELPCLINKLGHMTFKKHKNDSPESVNYPLSKKYYGSAVMSNLFRYEKYIKWPIRQMLTL